MIMRVLIVDDQRQLVDAITYFLKEKKIEFDAAYDGEEGYYLATSSIYDVIILDIMLPKIDGYEVLKKLRKKGVNTPILFFSAKSQIEDKINGLNLGADDYLTKPFDMNELLARIHALSRRSSSFESDIMNIENIIFDRTKRTISNNENSISLTSKEFEIFSCLASKKGIVNKEYLIDKIWGFDDNSDYNKIEVYITFLRRKLRSLKANIKIRSIRDSGYVIEKL